MRPGVKHKFHEEMILFWLNFMTVCVLLTCDSEAAQLSLPCDKSRKVFVSSWGVITDGPTGSNYTQDSHCEWLIKGMCLQVSDFLLGMVNILC